MKAVYAEAAAAAEQAGAVAPGRWWRRVWARVPAGRGFTMLAAAAAVAAVAVFAWGLAGRSSPQRSASVAVNGMAAAPHVHGELVMDRADREAVLTVTGLPGPSQVAGGSGVYEVWLILPAVRRWRPPFSPGLLTGPGPRRSMATSAPTQPSLRRRSHPAGAARRPAPWFCRRRSPAPESVAHGSRAHA